MVNLIVGLFVVFFASINYIDACNPSPCLNGGICVPVTSTISRCQCPVNFQGTFCETPASCSCKNGGTCRSTSSGFTCDCPSGFSGSTCELVNPCSYQPCKNGATCTVNANNDPVCTCLPGFSGSLCSVKIDPNACTSQVCQNGGTCYSEVSFFGTVTQFCKCPANFYGQFCEIQLTRQLCESPDQNYISCPLWRIFGFCSLDYKSGYTPVPIVCPASCSLCNMLPTCRDLQSSCSLWAAFGLCSTANRVDPNICRKSCNTCVTGIAK